MNTTRVCSIVMAITGLYLIIAGKIYLGMMALIISAIYDAEHEICKAIKESKKL